MERQAQKISLTAAGMRALKQWLAVPIPDWVAGRVNSRYTKIHAGSML